MQKKNKFSWDIKLLLIFQSLHRISDLFCMTFLVSFLVQNSTHEILSVSLYNFFFYAVSILGFFAIADWVKRHNKVAIFRFHLIPKILLFSAIIFMSGSIVEHVVLLGTLYGLACAFFWLPIHLMIGEKVAPNIMPAYSGYSNALGGITKILTPVLLGIFITTSSYEQVAVVLLGLCVIEFGLSFFIKPSMHRSKKKLDIVGFFKCMMRFPIIRKLFWVEMLRGFSVSGALGAVIVMYTVYMFKTDLNLGIFTTIFSIFSVITSLLFGRFVTKKMFPGILFSSVLASTLTLGLFMFYTTPVTFLMYNFIYVTGISLLLHVSEVNMYNLSNSKCVTREHKTEYFVFREAALVTGRLVGFVALMYLAVFGGYEYLRYFLGLFTITIILLGYYSIKISNHLK